MITTLRTSPTERAAWLAAARKAGISLSEWVRGACRAHLDGARK